MATKLTYTEQLKHPNWQRKRLEMLEAADWTCTKCDAKETTLHVHHKQYLKGRMAWEYDDSELEVLCELCHAEEHREMELLKGVLAATFTPTNLGLVAGFHNHDDWLDPGEREEARQTEPLAYAAGFVAYIVYGLDIDDMLKVARYASSLHNENAECRMVFEHNRGGTFGEPC